MLVLLNVFVQMFDKFLIWTMVRFLYIIDSLDLKNYDKRTLEKKLIGPIELEMSKPRNQK